jgi:hypothetical protein
MQQLWPDDKLAREFIRMASTSGNSNHAATQLLRRVRDEYEAHLAQVLTRAAAANSWANALENQLQKLLAESKECCAWEQVTAALPPAINDDGYSGEVEVRCIGWRYAQMAGWEVAKDEDGVAVTHWRFVGCPDNGRGVDIRTVTRNMRRQIIG